MTDDFQVPEALTPAGFATVLQETLQKQIQMYPQRAWYPSNAAHPCDRFLVWRWTRWTEQTPHGWVLQSIFSEGNLHAPSIYRRLEEMGFQVIRESDRPTQWKVGNKAVISGRVDGRVTGFRGQKFPKPLVLEIKTMQPWAWDKLNTIEDVIHAPEHYLRGYWGQMQLYLLLEEHEQGLMVIKNKSTGLLKAMLVELDFAAAEAMVQRIERLQAMVDAKEDPPPISYDQGICGRCGFLALCYPPKDYGTGLQLFEDVELLEHMKLRAELKAKASEYDQVDKSIKQRLKRLGTFEAALLGPFMIERKEIPVKGYTVEPRTDIRFDITRVEEMKKQIEDASGE